MQAGLWRITCLFSLFLFSLPGLTAEQKNLKDIVYTPDPQAAAVYDKLYAEYDLLHEYFGCGGNDAMKRLKALRIAVKKAKK